MNVPLFIKPSYLDYYEQSHAFFNSYSQFQDYQ